MDDMDVLDFASEISTLPINTPLSAAYDKLHGQKRRRWWSCQREHLTVWCRHYPAGGTKGYSHQPSNSAAKMYNSFFRPETLLWLAEALGEDEGTLKSIIEEIKEIPRGNSACGIVREHIPFSRILELIGSKSKSACFNR